MNLNLSAFLTWVVSPVGCGVLVFGLIEFVNKLLPTGLTPNQRFYGAMAAAFALPPLAYAAEIALGWQVLDPAAVFEVIAVGYAVSQTIHRTTALAAAALPVLVPDTTWSTAVSPVLSVPLPSGTASVSLPANPTATVTYTPPAPLAPPAGGPLTLVPPSGGGPEL